MHPVTDLVTHTNSNEERGTEHAEGITCCLGYGGEEGGVEEESMITFLGQVRERSLFLSFFKNRKRKKKNQHNNGRKEVTLPLTLVRQARTHEPRGCDLKLPPLMNDLTPHFTSS